MVYFDRIFMIEVLSHNLSFVKKASKQIVAGYLSKRHYMDY